VVNDVGNILSGAMRAQLLALQKTARQLDGVSARLASGQKVSSALDNPGSYFLARSLRNRAGDLTRLLDGIGQNIQAVKEADHGIEADLKLLDQAESYLLDVLDKYQAGTIPLVPAAPTNETYVNFTGPADFTTYVSGQDVPASGTTTVPTGNEVDFAGNFWKRKAFNYTITPDTVLVFDYKSTLQPEIAAIGFDNDTDYTNDSNRFFIYGSQTSGINTPVPYSTYAYTGAGAWQTIEIPIGTYFTGTFNHITFINDDDAAPIGNSNYRNITLREGAVQHNLQADPSIEQGYADIVNQIDRIAVDANYRGINLLKNESMTTYFNENNTNKLVTQGIDATFAGLGLGGGNFNSQDAVEAKLAQVRAAREKLRTFSTTLATDLTVLQVRQDFTSGTVNIHKTGADKLTNADLNEEGANLLALQTAQQIGVTSLSLAAQARASTMKMFA